MIAIGCLHTTVILMMVGCGDVVDTSEISSEVSVSTYTSSSCSTSVVLGLSKQIAEQVGCSSPGSLVAFDPGANLVFSSNAVLPYMHAAAKADLLKVAETRTVQVNSGFRTVAQQYLLYRWYQLGRCGITAAATPGRSNHQSGRAVDLANYSSLISAMSNRGWAHDVPGDPVHFDHLSSPDIRGQDIKAFQRLWNRNHPNDTISEDGSYGPQTEARLKAAPATGFAIGASCGSAAEGSRTAETLMIDGPDKLAPGGKAHYSITIANLSATDWPGTVSVMSPDGVLHDATWTSDTKVGTLDSLGAGDIGAGAQGVLDIAVEAPMLTEETALSTELTLLDGATVVGTIRIAVTVTPNGDAGQSSDAGDEHDDVGEVSGGCNAGGSSGWLVWLAPGLLVLRRRRR